MRLAAATHHSSPKGGLPGATRNGPPPGVLKELEPPNVVDRVQRHILGQTLVSAPGLQILDVPVPQMGDQLVDVLKIIDTSPPCFAEQVIEVPKIFHQDTTPQPSVLRRPQLAEQVGSAVGFSVILCRPAFCRADR